MAAKTINNNGLTTNITLGTDTSNIDILQDSSSDPIQGPCVLFFYWASEDQSSSNLLTVDLGDIAQNDTVTANAVELAPGASYVAKLYVPPAQKVGVVGSSAFDVVVQVVR